jgi:hypothetical protein
MTTLRQAAEQALIALERADKISGHANNKATITALRQALEADEKPCPCCGDGNGRLFVTRVCDTCGSEYAGQAEMDMAKRIAAEQQDEPLQCDICGAECADPWHFSTESKRHQHSCDACWIVQAEPVAFEFYNPATGHAILDYSEHTHLGHLSREMGYIARPLVRPQPVQQPLTVTADAYDRLEALCQSQAKRIMDLEDSIQQPAQQPLTDKQIDNVWRENSWGYSHDKQMSEGRFFDAVRAIERAHHIGGEA